MVSMVIPFGIAKEKLCCRVRLVTFGDYTGIGTNCSEILPFIEGSKTIPSKAEGKLRGDRTQGIVTRNFADSAATPLSRAEALRPRAGSCY